MIEITPQYLDSQGLSESFPARFWAKVNKNGPVPSHRPELGPCWVWTGFRLRTFGYGQVFARWELGKTITILAHRASWILNVGPVPDGKCILHKCDNMGCIRPIHLWTGTLQDNIRDMDNKGRRTEKRAKGEDNGRSKLSEQTVLAIRQRRNEGLSVMEISRELQLPYQNVWAVSNNRTWKHVQHTCLK